MDVFHFIPRTKEEMRQFFNGINMCIKSIFNNEEHLNSFKEVFISRGLRDDQHDASTFIIGQPEHYLVNTEDCRNLFDGRREFGLHPNGDPITVDWETLPEYGDIEF